MTWSPFEEGDNRGEANGKAPHFIEAYGFNSQGDTACFPTYTYPAWNGDTVTKTLTDYGFRAHPEDPMFVWPYEYPFNFYKRVPPTADIPSEPEVVNWLRVKRDVALGVLNQDLPISAIEDAEGAELLSKAAEAFLDHHSEAEPAATHAAEFSIPTGTDAAVGSSWQPWSEQHMPVETGVPGAEEQDDSRMMRRRRQHLQEHQQRHAHGH
ncbi:predicted protein [Aspergillus terreus NIH2624]|uniref:Uncharacterized protein n=1 Tax=Aspergillus terreus (strain NIH 2624 / FGSC A1156) TaxID=341663 RepID=Q0CEC0_ASPTN|nr:uncharacterized protein ATEG_07964 [Aspergillus terreus NIH2624]EAU32226.1 predicted protein [Aspergillus terreus NIH2624]